MRVRLHVYRGYRVYPGEKGCTATFIYSSINYHLPRKFKFSAEAGIADLHRYIDALVDRRSLEIKKYEGEDLAYAQEYEDPPAEVPIIRISPELLISVLLGEYPLDVPIHSKLQMKGTGGGKFVPDYLPAELADAGLLDAYYEGLRDFIEQGKPYTLREKLRPLEPNVSMPANGFRPSESLLAAEQQGKGEVVEAPKPQPPTETPIESHALGDCVEALCAIESSDNDPYFVRRIFTAQGACIYTATSWSLDGPWSVHTMDPKAKRLLEAA